MTPPHTINPATVTPITLARNIHVSRRVGSGGEFDMSIDGVPFGFFLAGDKGAQIKVSTDTLSAVTITILAETVTVDDQMMSGGTIEHLHNPDAAFPVRPSLDK